MTKPTNRPEVIVPNERTPSFGQAAVNAIRAYPNVNDFVDDSVAFQNGVQLLPRLVAHFGGVPGPILMPTRDTLTQGTIRGTENFFVKVQADGTGFDTSNLNPNYDGGYTVRNQMLYANTQSILRDFSVDENILDSRGAASVAFIDRTDYRSLRMRGFTGTQATGADNIPSVLGLPCIGPVSSLTLHAVVLVPEGGNFLFTSEARTSAAGSSSDDFFRISTTNTTLGQSIYTGAGYPDNVGNIATEDRGGNVTRMNSRLPAPTSGGLYLY